MGIEAKTEKPSKVLVLFSGGLDSAMTARHYKDRGWDIRTIYFNYAQPWFQEHQSALRISMDLGVILRTVNVARLPVLDKNFVPARNAHLLTAACSLAYAEKIPYVAIGANTGEFLDQSAEFIDRFNFMMDFCFKGDDHPWVLAPFCNWSKERIFKYAIKIGFPIKTTRSCMHEPVCGVCLACKLRRKYGVED